MYLINQSINVVDPNGSHGLSTLYGIVHEYHTASPINSIHCQFDALLIRYDVVHQYDTVSSIAVIRFRPSICDTIPY